MYHTCKHVDVHVHVHPITTKQRCGIALTHIHTPLPMELAAHALFMITTAGISGGIRSSWHQGGTGGENMA